MLILDSKKMKTLIYGNRSEISMATCTITGHKQTKKENDRKAAFIRAFTKAIAIGATCLFVSGCAGNPSITKSADAKQAVQIFSKSGVIEDETEQPMSEDEILRKRAQLCSQAEDEFSRLFMNPDDSKYAIYNDRIMMLERLCGFGNGRSKPESEGP
jgi:hypothetical protein